MKKILPILALFLASLNLSLAQCNFTGLAPTYCTTDPAAPLTTTATGGSYLGAGMIGNVFNPGVAGPGTHTVTYAICNSNYSVAAGTFSPRTTSGNPVSLSDDAVTGALPIGFTFKFFCVDYTDFYISSNGFIGFSAGMPNGCCTGQLLPSAATPNNLITFSWQDFNPGSLPLITYTTIGTAPNRILIVSYNAVPHFSGGGPQTAQIQIYEQTNVIEIHTTDMQTNGSNHTMGIEDLNGTVAFVVPGRNSTTNWSASNEMWRFTPIPGCVSSQVTTITGSINIVGPDTICAGDPITLTSSGNVSYTWTSPASNLSSINVSPTVTTGYDVMGTNTNGCKSSASKTITVKSLPVINIGTLPQVLCVGKSSTVLTNGAVTYTLNGSTPVSPPFTLNPVTSTNYTITGTNVLGCKSTKTLAITVSTNTLGVTPNTSVCEGESVMLTANNAVTYTWSTGNKFPSIPVTPVTNTTYIIQGTDMYNCVLSNTVSVTVVTKPNVTASASKNPVCKGESAMLMASGATTYTWNGSLGSGQEVTINPLIDVVYGYTVTGTAANGCTNTAYVAVTVSRCTDLEQFAGITTGPRVYPNPAYNEMTVEINSNLVSTIEIVDVSGRVVIALSGKENINKVNVSHLAGGLYYVKVKSQDHTETIKLIKN